MPRDIQELEEWIEKHPYLALFNAIGIGLLIAEMALILRHLLGRLQ